MGPPSVALADGTVLPIVGLPLALLAYLAVEKRPTHREHLATLFWPGLEHTRSRHALRQAIHRLRSALPKEVIIGSTILEVPSGALTIDLEEFSKHLAEARPTEAMGLYRGEFLSGFTRSESWELSDWVDGHRSRLEQSLSAMALEHIGEYLANGEAEEALVLVQAAQALLPMEERLRPMHATALAALGRIPEAEGLLPREGEHDEEATWAEARTTLSLAKASRTRRRTNTLTPLAEVKQPRGQVPKAHRLHITARLAAVLLIGFGISLGASAIFSSDITTRGPDASAYDVLFCSRRATEDHRAQLFRMRADGSGKHRISEDESCLGVWFPDAGVMLARARTNSGPFRLFQYTPDPDNSIAEWSGTIVHATADLVDPWFSHPAATQVVGSIAVFSAIDSTGNRDIWALDLQTNRLSRLTDDPGIDAEPSFDANTSTVVFTSDRTANGDLYSVRLDGSHLTRITDHPLQDGAPSLRGDTVLFTRGLGTGKQDGNLELVFLSISSGAETTLTENAWNDYEVSWSPSGRYLCWQSERLGHYESDIMVMDLMTDRTWALVSATGRDADCRWGEDESGVLFMTWRSGSQDLYYQALAGGEPIDIGRYPRDDGLVGIAKLPPIG